LKERKIENYTVYYYLLSALLLIPTITIYFLCFEISFISLIIFYLVVIIIVYGLVIGLGFRINRILTTECDPERFLSQYDRFYRINARKEKQVRFQYRRIIALTHLGQDQVAEESFDKVTKPVTTSNKTWYLAYRDLELYFLVKAKKFEEAKKLMDELDANLTDKDKQKYKIALKNQQAAYLMETGELKESREIYQELLAIKTSKLNTMVYRYRLGKIEMWLHDYQQARLAFERVIAEGNKLYLVTEAKEALQEIAGKQGA